MAHNEIVITRILREERTEVLRAKSFSVGYTVRNCQEPLTSAELLLSSFLVQKPTETQWKSFLKGYIDTLINSLVLAQLVYPSASEKGI